MYHKSDLGAYSSRNMTFNYHLICGATCMSARVLWFACPFHVRVPAAEAASPTQPGADEVKRNSNSARRGRHIQSPCRYNLCAARCTGWNTSSWSEARRTEEWTEQVICSQTVQCSTFILGQWQHLARWPLSPSLLSNSKLLLAVA